AILGWPNAQLTICDITFSRFIDLGEPSSVRASLRQRSAASARLLMRLAQAGHTAAHGGVTITNLTCEEATPKVPSYSLESHST
ncbi:MAG: hypothetical protein ACRDSH_09885, partial [Pseudonocardiaceae bacterium]